MNFNIDFSQPSTIRGLVWFIFGIIGLVMLFMGKDISQLTPLAAAVAGGLGLGLDDNKPSNSNYR